jgi:hypothetical protein
MDTSEKPRISQPNRRGPRASEQPAAGKKSNARCLRVWQDGVDRADVMESDRHILRVHTCSSGQSMFLSESPQDFLTLKIG